MVKRRRYPAVILVWLAFVPAMVAQPELPRLVRTRAGIIDYLNAAAANEKILVGQHTHDNGLYDIPGAYRAYVEGLYRRTGKYPALLGADYGMKADVSYSAVNQNLINHWKAGGLVTLCWHADCPWFDGYDARFSSTRYREMIDVTKLLKGAPESPARTSYRRELMAVGTALAQLRDAGVIVLWRPFHEMNGVGFWWGTNDIKHPTNRAAFALLWRDMHATFTRELKLDNLIWVFSAHFSCAWASPVGALYPGDDVVDVVGVDVYTDAPSFADHDVLKKAKKPIVVTEIGPSRKTMGAFDEVEIIETLRGKAAYFVQWHSWEGARMAIMDNLNFYEMMHHASAITLDELND